MDAAQAMHPLSQVPSPACITVQSAGRRGEKGHVTFLDKTSPDARAS